MSIDKAELLARQIDGRGTHIVNCLTHEHRSITERPDECKLCLADLRNHMNSALRVNAWLNQWKEDATELLQVFKELSISDK